MNRLAFKQLLLFFVVIFAFAGCLAQYRGRYVTLFYADSEDARRLGSLSDGERDKPDSLRYSGKVVLDDVRETDTLSEVLLRQARKNGWDDVDKYNFKFEMLINAKQREEEDLSKISYPMLININRTEEKQRMSLTLSRNDSLMRFAKDSPLSVFTLGWDEEMGDCVAIYPYYHWLFEDEGDSADGKDPEPKGPQLSMPLTEPPKKIYTIELYALGDYYPELPDGDVSWARVFSAKVREGDEVSLPSLVSDAGAHFDESMLREWNRHPLWGLGDGRSYDLSMLWVPESALGGRPSDPVLAGELMSGAFAGDSLEAMRRMEPSDESCWFHGQPDASGTLRFYASYMLNQKTWGVEFYALSTTGKWSLVSSQSGLADMGDEEVAVDLPSVSGADVETPSGWWSPLNEWAADPSRFDDRSLAAVDDIAIAAKAVRGACAGRTQAKLALNAESDTTRKLYARYEPEWVMDFHILDGEYEDVESDDEIKWTKIASKRLKQGDSISVGNVLVQGRITIPEKLSEMLKDNQRIRPIWGAEDGNRYSNAMMWKSVSPDADMSVKANADAFFVSRTAKKTMDFSDFWDFQPDSWVRDYNSKPEVKSFSPRDFNVSDTGRRISMYPAYLELDEIKTVFYVVSSFAQEKFTWSAFEYADSAGKAGYSVHEVPAGAVVPDPDLMQRVPDPESDALADGSGKLANGIKNVLVFKGWRRIDPKTEFDQKAIENKSKEIKDYFDVSDEGNRNGILYDCACQRVKKRNAVEKKGFYWDKGSFTNSKADGNDSSVPQIYVAVYEYRHSVCSVWTKNPEYKNFKYSADHSSASADTDPQTRLRQIELILSAGTNWEMNVTRTKYCYYNDALTNEGSKDLTARIVGVGANSGNAHALDVGEKDTSGNYTTLFKYLNVFECAVWWITNPSGYEFPFAFYTKSADGSIFTMPATSNDAPSYSL